VAVSARFGRAGTAPCCRSSMVEHSLGKGEVDSSILSASTRKNSVAQLAYLAARGGCPTWPLEAAILFAQLEFGGVVNAAAGRERLVHDRRGGVRGVGGSCAPSRLWAAVRPSAPAFIAMLCGAADFAAYSSLSKPERDQQRIPKLETDNASLKEK
jgi:hypothetical protein